MLKVDSSRRSWCCFSLALGNTTDPKEIPSPYILFFPWSVRFQTSRVFWGAVLISGFLYIENIAFGCLHFVWFGCPPVPATLSLAPISCGSLKPSLFGVPLVSLSFHWVLDLWVFFPCQCLFCFLFYPEFIVVTTGHSVRIASVP